MRPIILFLAAVLATGCAPSLLNDIDLASNKPRAIVSASEAVFIFPPLVGQEFAWHQSESPVGASEYLWSVRPGAGGPETGSVVLRVVRPPAGSRPRSGTLRELVAAGNLMASPPGDVTSVEPVAGREDLVAVRTTARPDARLREAAGAIVRDGRVILRLRGREAVRQLVPDDADDVTLLWMRLGEEPRSVHVPVERR